MGNSNSNGSLDFEYNLTASEYSPVRKYNDFLLGEFFEVKHNVTNEIILLKVRTIHDKSKYQQTIENCFQRLSLHHKNLAQIYGFAGRDASGPINNLFKLYIYFQTLPKDLARILRDRKSALSSLNQSRHSKKSFTEDELFNLMYQMVDVLEYLQVNGISHGDIRPEACFFNEKGDFMICDRRIIYEEELNYRNEKNSDKNYLFSPAALKAYINGEKDHKENKHKADVFSVGMTLLECATFRRSAQIYEWGDNPMINMETLSIRLLDIQNKYSSMISKIIVEMLRFDESLRPDFVRLKKWLIGAEPIGYSNVVFSPIRGKLSPQLSKSIVGPKLVGPNPNANRVSRKSSTDTGKIASKKLEIDDASLLTYAFEHDKSRRNTDNGEEEEVIEFETEETPKRNYNITDTTSYLGLNTMNSDPIKSVLKSNHQEENVSNSSSPKRYSTAYSPNSNIRNQIYQGNNAYSLNKNDHSNIEYINDKMETNKKSKNDLGVTKGLNTIVSIDSEEDQNSMEYNYQSLAFGKKESTNNQSSNNFVHPFLTTLSLNKAHAYNENLSQSPNSRNIKPHPLSKDQMKPKLASPQLKTNSPLEHLNSTGSTEVNKGSFLSQLDSPVKDFMTKASKGKNIFITPPSPNNNKITEYPQFSSNKNVKDFLIVSPLPTRSESVHSPSHSQGDHETIPYTFNVNNKLDTSLHFDNGADPEQWRSLVVDGLTYNSISSVSPDTPRKMLKKNTPDLLSQQLQATSLNKPSTTRHQYSYSNNEQLLKKSRHVFEQRSLKGSRASIDEFDINTEGTIQFKQSGKVGYSVQESRTSLSGTHTPENKYVRTSPLGGRNFETDNSTLAKLKDLEIEERFKRAMERSKETYSILQGKGSRGTASPTQKK